MAVGVYDHRGLDSLSTSISERCGAAVDTFRKKLDDFVREYLLEFGQVEGRRVGWKSSNIDLVDVVLGLVPFLPGINLCC